MNLQDLLEKTVIERFKVSSVIKALEKKINGIVEQNVLQKYDNKLIYENDMEFELIGVNAHFWAHEIIGIYNINIDIALAFTCKSKLPKIKRDKLEKVKYEYEQTKRLEWNNYKIPIWKELNYRISLEEALSGDFRLNINNEIV